jgi:hypothetical protein
MPFTKSQKARRETNRAARRAAMLDQAEVDVPEAEVEQLPTPSDPPETPKVKEALDTNPDE